MNWDWVAVVLAFSALVIVPRFIIEVAWYRRDRTKAQARAMLIPVGASSMEWRTPLTVEACYRELQNQSGPLGLQVYGSQSSIRPGPLRVVARFRSWWYLQQVAELVVDIEPDHKSGSATLVRARSGLRLGVAIVSLVWVAVLLVPLLVFPSVPTKVFFALVLGLPLVSVFINTRLQIRSAMRKIRSALPAVPVPADSN